VKTPVTVTVPVRVGPVALIVLVPGCKVTATGSFNRPDVVVCTRRLTPTPPVDFGDFVPAAPPFTLIDSVPVNGHCGAMVPLIVPPGAVEPRLVTPLQPGGT
jgi:hypothetical protein